MSRVQEQARRLDGQWCKQQQQEVVQLDSVIGANLKELGYGG